MDAGDPIQETDTVIAAVRDALAPWGPPATVHVGFSGGLDSTVLLAACTRVAARTVALHVHHGMHTDAGTWARHCRSVAEELGCSFVRSDVEVDPSAGGPEAAARDARYRAFREALPEDGILMLAQHAGDQTETVLLQLFRGAGPEGLAGMPAAAALGRGRLLRPFLHLERAQLEVAARAWGLDWLEDPSNQDRRHPRNHLRLDVLPGLRGHWPALDRTLGRAARHLADAQALLEDLAALDLERARGEGAGTLAVAAVEALPRHRQANLIRHWLRRQALPMPDSRRLASLLAQLQAGDDRRPRVAWDGAEVRRFAGQLYAMPPLPPAPEPTAWPDPGQALSLPGCGRVELVATGAGQGLDPSRLAAAAPTLGFRERGQRLRLAGDRHTRSLRRLFHEAGIPPWMRDRVPVLYAGDEPVALAGLGPVEGWQAPSEVEGLRLVWEMDPWVGDDRRM